jgi:hypothetical protein
MNRQTLLASLSSLGVAIGAGLASALLSVVFPVNGTLIAFALAYFAPLPVMIACLGFGQWTGLFSGIVGSGLIAALLYPSAGVSISAGASALPGWLFCGLLYAGTIALPAWLICAAALRGAPPLEPQTRARSVQKSGAIANAAPMRALTTATLFFAAAFSVGALALAATYGGLNSALGQLTSELTLLLREVRDAMTSWPPDLEPESLARVIGRSAGPAMAASALSIVLANLWLAARIVQISARLPTPWPDIPYNLRLPVPFAAALIPAIGLIFVGHEIGFVAAIASTTLGTALSLQGLAVMHYLTRGMSTRTPLLFGAYILVSFIPLWPMALFALVGLADAALGLRERKRLRQSAPPPST